MAVLLFLVSLVVGVSAKPKVRGIATLWIVARVKNVQAERNLTFGEFVGYAMGAVISIGMAKNSVAMSIQAALPLVTAFGVVGVFGDFSPKNSNAGGC